MNEGHKTGTAGDLAPGHPDYAPDWQAVVNSLAVPLYAIDTSGLVVWHNKAAEQLWGRAPAEGEHWDAAWRAYWPDGTPMSPSQCPTAVSLLQRYADPATDVIVERPDGERTLVSVRPVLQFNRAGELAGVVSALVDQGGQKHIQQHRALAAIVETSQDAIIGKDLNGIITSWNDGATWLFGYRADEMLGQSITRLIPASLLAEEEEIIQRIRQGERVGHFTTIRQHKEGYPVDISLTISPIKAADGRVIGASKIAHEITGERRVLSEQSLLLREMNHRVKNLFALAGALVTLSARHTDSPVVMAKSASARLHALAKAHGLTLGAADSGAPTTLRELVWAMVSPFAEMQDTPDMLLDGPSVLIDADAVTGLALLLHELATNAAKYGAFSTANGRVEVRWHLSGDQLHLVWSEAGGPPISGRPDAEGFGTLLARSTVRSRLGGNISYDWNRDGITVRLAVAKDRLNRTGKPQD